jgi:hypothetical protein
MQRSVLTLALPLEKPRLSGELGISARTVRTLRASAAAEIGAADTHAGSAVSYAQSRSDPKGDPVASTRAPATSADVAKLATAALAVETVDLAELQEHRVFAIDARARVASRCGYVSRPIVVLICSGIPTKVSSERLLPVG